MSDIQNIAGRSAAAVGRALHAGETTPTALTEFLLDRIASCSEPVFLATTPDRALDEARRAETRIAAGRPLSPLDGVPVAWKDLFDMQGVTTTAGSTVYRDAEPAAADAAAVANLTAAGMVNLGKLNLTEFAYSGLGLNPHFGTPANPRAPGTRRAPGGSSSGSGVAVAAGLAPAAIGTDTGGSVRIPAALNGVFGYKPSAGRISDTGVFPLSRTLDTVGPLARSVEDLVLLDAALRGLVSPPVRRAGLEGVEIFVPETIVLDGVEPAVMENFEASLRRLEEAGARIDRGPLEDFGETQHLAAEHGSLAAADAYFEHRDLVDGPDVEHVDSRVVDRILGGKRMTAHDVVALQRARAVLIASVQERFLNRFIAMPTVSHSAPEIAPLEADKKLFHEVNMKTLRNTMIGNFLDLAGLAIPNGMDENGLPTSFLLSVPRGADDKLLAIGQAVEASLAAR